MDGVHDLGGREGFGPVRWQLDDDHQPFHEDWEARAWALFLVFMRYGYPAWTLDWCRHVKERIGPIDYLSHNYFDLWTQTAMAITIEDGVADLDEFVQGQARFKPKGPPSQQPAIRSAEGAPAFAIGETVRVKHLLPDDHTRRPGYTRGRGGIVEDCIGLRPLADASARGEIRDEYLYSVAFDGSELWPEAVGRRDRIFVDLWESYLETP
ncbi:MAG: nitrile hydratase subunit beta [Rhodospirillaceae bacterium]|jgi:nitrile hydratase subunit beta|nr:nitrile hydratase subunit beta [Rhodospirillaceae bacterium]MBT4489261.1 nitrile hydratase subunit beta [Rhodospirillaceae bacterium]MBT5191819.1 nitrile hydratase subunit beta [Rhodospirillaceae bacterium]MBT5456985.1 nitrile hydratase subunit beta [Rhodospirillaceae bacterium]MBT5896128.1 nitrile hydratase subunit beta [Rhodospirillaceae bacterium]